MAATIWKTSSNTEILISGDPGNQFAPSIADSGGGSFGVAWTSANGVTVRFYDAVGALDPALGTIQLSDGLGHDHQQCHARGGRRGRLCGRVGGDLGNRAERFAAHALCRAHRHDRWRDRRRGQCRRGATQRRHERLFR